MNTSFPVQAQAIKSSRSTLSSRSARFCNRGKGDRGYSEQVALARGPDIILARPGGRNDDEAGSTSLRSVNGKPLDTFRFLLEWLRHPGATAAIAPSSEALVSMITRRIGQQTGTVLELGPGTGVFTQGLIQRGVAEADLTLVEQNQTFARLLRQRFPRATILNIDAADLNQAPGAASRDFGAAVCGLGLRTMDAGQVEAILRGAFDRMKPEAVLYLFTYGWRCSVSDELLDRLGLVAERLGTTLRNVPPASVYRLARLPGAR